MKSATDLTNNEMYDILVELGCSEAELDLVCKLNGFNKETFLDVLYEKFGLRDFDQIDDDE